MKKFKKTYRVITFAVIPQCHRPLVVSGSMASYCKETLTISPPVSGSKALHCEGTLTTLIVPATQVEDEQIQQEIVEEVQTQEDSPEQGVVRRSTRERRRADFYMGLHQILVVDTKNPLSMKKLYR